MFNINQNREFGLFEFVFMVVLMSEHQEYNEKEVSGDFKAARKDFYGWLMNGEDYYCALKCLLCREPTDDECEKWLKQLDAEGKLSAAYKRRPHISAILAGQHTIGDLHGAN